MEVDEIVDVYRRLASIPSVNYATIGNATTAGHVTVHSEWSQRDLERSEKIRFNRTHVVQLNEVFSTPPHETDEQWNRESASGKYRAIVRKIKDKKGEDNQFIEVWNANKKIHNIDVKNLTQHGQIYDNDGVFGCLEWSNSETHLLYVAEKKIPEACSFFKKLDAEKDEPKDMHKGEQFLYHEHWGEMLSEKHCSVLCVLDVEFGVASVLENTPEGVSPAQAVWCLEDSGVICVGWWHGPYRLGGRGSLNRRSSLFHINLKTYECVTLDGKEDHSVRSPVFSPDFTKLVYLQNKVGGPHAQCSQLMMCDWSTKGIVCVVDTVKRASAEDFPGLDGLGLQRRCWTGDNRHLLLQTQWRSKVELVLIDTMTGTVTRMTNSTDIGCWTLLDVHSDLVIAACSSLNQPQYLMLGRLCMSDMKSDIVWTKLDTEVTLIRQISWEVIHLDVPKENVNQQFPHLDYECLLLTPKHAVGDQKLPLIVNIHGGPHCPFGIEFSHTVAGFCLCGYMVLIVNYRGSTGFGQDSIDSLLGHIGTQDVNDVQYAVKNILPHKNIDDNRMVVIGGSHGGFLTAHIIGQCPRMYKAAVCENPATNLVTLTSSTDLPDWVYTECGLQFEYKNIADGRFNEELWKRSPMQYVDKIRTPTMIMLGANDRRVPVHQGHLLHKALKARNVETRLLVYSENGHLLTKVDSEADAFVNVINWFNKYTMR